jgi:hypothetical protein
VWKDVLRAERKAVNWVDKMADSSASLTADLTVPLMASRKAVLTVHHWVAYSDVMKELR